MSQLNLNTINRRRYEHKVTKNAKPEFIQFLRQAAAKEEFSEALYALFSQAVIENTSMASKSHAVCVFLLLVTMGISS